MSKAKAADDPGGEVVIKVLQYTEKYRPDCDIYIPRGERLLLTAVLDRAIRDVLWMPRITEAREWIGLDERLTDDTAEPWTFSWVCLHLGIDTDELRCALSSTLSSYWRTRDTKRRLARRSCNRVKHGFHRRQKRCA
jgi:hypothetical protein